MPIRTFLLPAVAALIGAGVAAAPTLGAQPATDTTPSAPRWFRQLAFEVRGSHVVSSAQGEFYALVARELQPGARALRPSLPGVGLHWRAAPRLRVHAAYEAGNRTARSVHRSRPTGVDVAQRTTLDYTSVSTTGAEWNVITLHHGAAGGVAPGHLRVLVGAGAGRAAYTLRQWGDFVDERRNVVFSDDLRSNGHGDFGWVQLALEAPLSRHIAVRGDVRGQRGGARMSGDFAFFDRLDLGGTRWGAGLIVTPFAAR